MSIRIGRTLPPTAAPIPLVDVLRALPSCLMNNSGICRFEQDIKKEFNQPYCLLVSSGKAALVLILKTLQKLYPDRNEVLIPAFTCYSVPAAIKRAGLKITLCDTGEKSLDFDKKQLKKIIREDRKKNKILCVLVTHLFGCPADFTGIKKIVGSKVPIVEDAAQAMGEAINNRKLGTLADIGFFSLGRGKALSTMGGGVIVTKHKYLRDQLANLLIEIPIDTAYYRITLMLKTILTMLLQRPSFFWMPKVLPFLRLGETIYDENFPIRRMSSFNKKLAHNWQKRLKGHQEARRQNVDYWQDNLPKSLYLICSGQKATSLIRLPVLARSTKERDRFVLKSESAGSGIMPTYPTPISDIPKIAHEFTG
ncbi:DegT/DnrJ/EryC1/StrS family aminotransferase, partial [Desulfobulbus sp. N2]|nr:DegT/DnrJ/EryC1/StrS family aminotransferase [Desulfobulbus sp. N2]